MTRLRLTKSDLKREKDTLRQLKRYLPMLLLKKLQLHAEKQRIQLKADEVTQSRVNLLEQIHGWIAVLGEGGLEPHVKILELPTKEQSIAGVRIPVFCPPLFESPEPDYFHTPPWIDQASIAVRELITIDHHLQVLQHQIHLLDIELRTTSQRVNLFERVRIPQSQNNIHRLQIHFGDQQTAAVVRGKLAKSKHTASGATQA